jgi:hypothetical protein
MSRRFCFRGRITWCGSRSTIGRGWKSFQAHGVTPETDRLYHIAIETDDAEGMRLYLQSRGVAVPPKTGVGKNENKQCFAKDPNGNAVELVEPVTFDGRPRTPWPLLLPLVEANPSAKSVAGCENCGSAREAAAENTYSAMGQNGRFRGANHGNVHTLSSFDEEAPRYSPSR